MRRLLRGIVGASTGMLAVSLALAGERVLSLPEGAAPAPARIADVAWIAGDWRGTALGGRVQEVWTEPAAGAMVGLFRLDRGDVLAFSELLHITEESGTLILRLKHFEPDLGSWEEQGPPPARRLVRLAPDAAYFEGLTFERAGGDGLTAVVLMGEGEARRELAFTYRRAGSDEPEPAEVPQTPRSQ